MNKSLYFLSWWTKSTKIKIYLKTKVNFREVEKKNERDHFKSRIVNKSVIVISPHSLSRLYINSLASSHFPHNFTKHVFFVCLIHCFFLLYRSSLSRFLPRLRWSSTSYIHCSHGEISDALKLRPPLSLWYESSLKSVSESAEMLYTYC